MGQDAGFAISETTAGWRQLKPRLRRELDIESPEAQLLVALLCASGDLWKKLRQSTLAVCPYARICLLAVDEAQVKVQSAGDGIFQADPDLPIYDSALGRATQIGIQRLSGAGAGVGRVCRGIDRARRRDRSECRRRATSGVVSRLRRGGERECNEDHCRQDCGFDVSLPHAVLLTAFAPKAAESGIYPVR